MLTSKGWTWLIKYGFLKHYIHLVDDWLDDDMLTDLTACWLSSRVSMSETVPLHLYIYIYIKCKPLYIYIHILYNLSSFPPKKSSFLVGLPESPAAIPGLPSPEGRASPRVVTKVSDVVLLILERDGSMAFYHLSGMSSWDFWAPNE